MIGRDGRDFRAALSEVTGGLSPSLRDVQKAIQLHARIPATMERLWPAYAHILLLKVRQDQLVEKLENLNRVVVSSEIERIGWAVPESGADALKYVRSALHWSENEFRFKELLSGKEGASPMELETLQWPREGRSVR